MSIENKSIFELNPSEKIEYAKNKLKLAIDQNDKVMISYWQELLISLLTRVPTVETKTYDEQPMKDTTSNEVKYEHASSNPKQEQRDTNQYEPPFFKDTRKEQAQKSLEKARLERKGQNIEFWQGVLDELTSKAYIYSNENELERLSIQKQRAYMMGNDELIASSQASIEDILKRHPIMITPDVWEQLDQTGKKHYMSLKAFEAKMTNKPTEKVYWENRLRRIDKGERINL